MTHAKAIFFGEHSVVYGKKGITIPLPEMKVTAELNKNNHIQKRDKILTYIAKKCNVADTTQIIIKSSIPVGRGLGSSAALSVAIARANKCPNIKEIADDCEKFIHGNPSGIDVNQVLSEKPLIFSKKDGAKPLNFNLNAFLLVIDTGLIGITKDAVKRVKENYEFNKIYIEELGEITEKVLPYLLKKDLRKIGFFMDKAHELLRKIGVSHEKNDDVVKICKNSGAIGAKITGGGDGGCCIALSENFEKAKIIQDKLKERGYLSWIVSV
ncbi:MULTISPECIES: mevalonate kinase [unclassified Gemella]|uniref:mevalonate kinase n=1 Tax=unclassified Gemella TaxID=2624949 RepID=UPI001C03D3B6|nr:MULTISPECIES: mevalonate kinase [unclassified Gemella]MBU0278642.1 mevalonate kinase [Gemella sp. zg-1178]QWQ39198.1 mevalonate kinase [Gemella sp. zg-570]